MKSVKKNQQPFMYGDFKQAFSKLKSAVMQKAPYVLLLGDSGLGKTTLLRLLASQLDRSRFNILYLCHGHASPSGLARVLAEALHLPLSRTRAETSRMLVQTLKNLPTRLLFWIDEAQLIRDDTLHELRLLAESDLDGPPVFSVVLAALPELKDRLLAPHLFPLWRRIHPRLSMTGLIREEIEPFLKDQLYKQSIGRFSEEALSVLFEQARGIPALLISYASFCLKSQTNGQISSELVINLLDQFEHT